MPLPSHSTRLPYPRPRTYHIRAVNLRSNSHLTTKSPKWIPLPLPYTEKSSPAANQRRDQPRRPSARVLFPAPASHTQRYVPPWRRDGNRIPSVRSPLPTPVQARTPYSQPRLPVPPATVARVGPAEHPPVCQISTGKKRQKRNVPTKHLKLISKGKKAKPSSKKKRATSRKSHPLPALSSDISRTVTQ